MTDSDDQSRLQSHNGQTRAGELAPILAHLNAGPSRTWSLIITVFGDSIMPRGQAVWLGTLLSLFRALDIGDGVVRTAMSRLTADGWLERTKVGRNSYYSLGEAGKSAFGRAADQIYTRRPPAWPGYFDLYIADPAQNPDFVRLAGEAAFGFIGGDAWIAPGGDDINVGGVIRLKLTGQPQELQALGQRAWVLDATAEAYRRFMLGFEPLGDALKSGLKLSELDALLTRTLLIHAYRRIVLRDPLLPLEILPEDWPGTAARSLCGFIYRRVLDQSERWLDDNAIGADGQRLAANPAIVGARFRD